MDNKISKFENPIRLAELDPVGTLTRLGFKENMVLCDIGAGTGIFSLPATKLSNGDVFALEISDSMIKILEDKKAAGKILNLKIMKVGSEALPLKDDTCDMAVIVTVLHELEDKNLMLKEVKRLLRPKGRLLIIEFHKRITPMGPPVAHRISEDFTEELCKNNGFKTTDKFNLGENFYGIVFEG